MKDFLKYVLVPMGVLFIGIGMALFIVMVGNIV